MLGEDGEQKSVVHVPCSKPQHSGLQRARKIYTQMPFTIICHFLFSVLSKKQKLLKLTGQNQKKVKYVGHGRKDC